VRCGEDGVDRTELFIFARLARVLFKPPTHAAHRTRVVTLQELRSRESQDGLTRSGAVVSLWLQEDRQRALDAP